MAAVDQRFIAQPVPVKITPLTVNPAGYVSKSQTVTIQARTALTVSGVKPTGLRLQPGAPEPLMSIFRGGGLLESELPGHPPYCWRIRAVQDGVFELEPLAWGELVCDAQKAPTPTPEGAGAGATKKPARDGQPRVS